MTKQIEDYPELDKFRQECKWDAVTIHKNEYYAYGEQDVEQMLLSMQQQIDELTKDRNKLAEYVRSSEFKNKKWLEGEVARLTEQNKELQERNLTDVKRAFWWSAEFTHVVHDGKINNAWIDFSENQLLNKESKKC